ncbi:sigma-70 family RNA polymerase sigma factor [Streptomyces sp. HNM0645]|uniref:RNA polymerase sigma factor n=1 Tax=Streptomyces sp. HNM0645 TaxID=2782343 RepID=UPI0024B711AA|nr:sigma-70 family RNA polymerase sigma factor [Streptomyces sp. HNM0645]MDI9882834.1 sigma-70 family RNA polymerase sigma factor [Streptomyces sp. HNM0645]
MATETHTPHSGGPQDGAASGGPEERAAQERWQRAWSHREDLLKVARRRSMSPEDAEDAVHEAMLRAAENPHLDDERLGAWLTTVTMRLCVDRYRQVSREAEVRSSPRLVVPRPAPLDEVVCDRAEARWLAVRSGELPARQAEALRLKSEDLDVGEVAREMGLSYRTVESLLARARRTLRASLAGTLGLALWLLGRRPRTGSHAHPVVAASAAATLAVAGFVVPFADDGDGPGRRPATSETADEWPAGDDRNRGTDGPAPSAGPAAASSAGATRTPGGPSVPLPLPDPALPSLPPVPPPAVPSVPDVPDVPGSPEVSGIPALPDPTAAEDTTVRDAPALPRTAVSGDPAPGGSGPSRTVSSEPPSTPSAPGDAPSP